MSTKKHYNLSVIVNTMRELAYSEKPIHVDKSIYAVQTVQPQLQFSELNNTGHGKSSTGNFSDSTSSFILFGIDNSGDKKVLRSLVYNAVCNLIGTSNNYRSICIVIPPIKMFGDANMAHFVEGIIVGLQTAMKDCTSVIKSYQQVIYFAVPSDMKLPLASALEEVD